jgi:hypothetical protein
MGIDIVNGITLALRRFDAEDKVGVARRLVEVLELEPNESLVQKVKDALSRDPTEDEVFKLGVLERIIKDQEYFKRDDFPDNFGAPKSGL